jgi:putative ABC transport system permease protein
MSLTWKLFAAHARQQKVRFALTALAMVAAVGVVLWVVSAYEAIAAKFDDQTADFIGNYTLFVVPVNPLGGLAPEVVAGVADDPAVQVANPVAQFRMRFRKAGDSSTALTKASTPAGAFGPLGPSVVGTASAEPRYELIDGRWLAPGTESEAVVSRVVADTLSLKPGDAIEFRTKDGPLALTVVGVTEQVKDVEWAMTRTKGGAPGGVNRGPASTTAYVPLGVVEKLTDAPPRINLVEVRLRPGKTVDQFRGGVAASLTAEGAAAELLLPEHIRGKLEGGFDAQGARKQAYFVTALSILASAFIIFTTLSTGVGERARQLAMLRAVGLRRSQVARLVLAEALVLAVFGWVGGLAGGWVLLKTLASASPGLFPNGVTPGGATLATTAACSLAGALLAAVFPIWKATRISPIEAMAPLPAPERGPRWYAALGGAALALVALNPVLVYLPDVPERLRFALVLLAGAPASVAGFVLAAPLAILAVERLVVPPLAWAFRLRPGLVQTQLSSHLWRSAGLAASLMLGLGLYTATQVWGWSMLGGFLPGRWTPNTIVKFDPGLTDEQVEQVRRTPGVRADACLPVAAEQVKLVGDPLKSGERDSAVRQDNVALVGVDADAAFGGEQPLFQLTFVQGDRAEALAKLKQGRYCLVPDTFPKYAGLGVGDKVGFVPPKAPDRPVEYTIAGVVEMPGSNWITKLSGVRRHSVRTAGIVFAPRAQVRDDFDLKRVEFVWLNAEPGTTKADLEERLRPLTGGGGAPGGPKAGGKTGPRAEGAVVGGGRGAGPEPLRVTLLDDVRSGLRGRGGSAVLAMGLLPLITLLVVSLGVVNTVAASVRARRWEFGVLRAVGLRRFGLIKLVFAEALLVGFVASILSFAFGIVTGWTCLGLVRYVSNPWFEGVTTPLAVPWSVLAIGYAMTFALCFLAALWPALSAGRAEPLALLQGGRSVG